MNGRWRRRPNEAEPVFAGGGLGIRKVWAEIAADSVRAARKVRLQWLQACQLVAANPGIGHSRRDLTEEPGWFSPVGAYLAIYDRESSPVAIARVVHGARDVPSLL